MNTRRRTEFDALEPDVAAWLDQSLCAASPGDAELLARVRARVMEKVQGEARLDFRTVRRDQGEWVTLGPGVQRKRLWTSSGTLSCLMRLAPGAVVEAHDHPMDEECIVLEGTLRIGELLLCAGDFHVAGKGTLHEPAGTDTGALVYLRGTAEEAA